MRSHIHGADSSHDARTEFIHLLSSESNDICEKGNKKTIAPEHVIAALKVSLTLLLSHRDIC